MADEYVLGRLAEFRKALASLGVVQHWRGKCVEDMDRDELVEAHYTLSKRLRDAEDRRMSLIDKEVDALFASVRGGRSD